MFVIKIYFKLKLPFFCRYLATTVLNGLWDIRNAAVGFSSKTIYYVDYSSFSELQSFDSYFSDDLIAFNSFGRVNEKV